MADVYIDVVFAVSSHATAPPRRSAAPLGKRRAMDEVGRKRRAPPLDTARTELEQRLAERDDAARDDALIELARTDAELEARLAARTIERDDAARDEALAQLARTNAELVVRLAERTIERDDVAKRIAVTELARTDAAEEQLRRQATELEALNAELESFSYSVSHDLRAPVRAISGYARVIEESCATGLGEEGRRLLAVVQSEALRMGDLIDDLLAFSRLGRQPLVAVAVNMTALAREAAEAGAPLPGSTAATFEIAELPPVRGDRMLLRQVWINLLSNAAKYSGHETSPRVRVWATADASSVTYHVRDNGVGFDMRYADKLFGVFQRMHRADAFPGTGVGLAIVMRIVVRHGGTVRADARLGEGATFSFALPSAC